MNGISTGRPRIDVVDALRGFAVLAIVLVHNLEHFIFPVYPADPPAWLAALDQGVFNVVFTLFAGKAYAIFSLLFGFTFYLQMSGQKQRGKDFGYRFLWRLVLLAGFATLDAAFFPAGDVLLLFTVVGLVLFIVRNWSDRAVLVLAVVFLLQPVEWFHCFASLADPSHTLPDLKVGEMYDAVAENTRNGNFLDFILCNITLGQKASLLWAVNAGRFFQTAGLFFLGFWLGTNYVTQSVIGALVYFPFGLYLAPHFGYTLSLLAGVAVFILQMLFCRWWLSRHRQGPLEYVWHKWTWIGTGR